MYATIRPLNLILEAVERSKSDSDAAFFMKSLSAAELIFKLYILGLTATVKERQDRKRYSLQYKLVRANGLGDWADVCDEILKGPTSQHIIDEARSIHNDTNRRFTYGDWEYSALDKLCSAIAIIDPRFNKQGKPNDLRGWFRQFPRLRNKARGHNFPKDNKIQEFSNALFDSTFEIATNAELFQNTSWAYLHRNISGKYYVQYLGKRVGAFDYLKNSKEAEYPNGVYINFGRPINLELLQADRELQDFFVPNGHFNKRTYEIISYITNEIDYVPSERFQGPPGQLPKSETHGRNLDLINKCFTNIPPMVSDYVNRKELEDELFSICRDQHRHPIMTLYGRGGLVRLLWR